MEEQRRVAEFVERHGLEAPPEFRLLDLVSELGEVAKEAAESTDYGDDPSQLRVEADEIGDVLFALLAVAESVDVDAGEALDAALSKYETRLDETGSPASGE
jgi:NTP pyrophosphatase (non-canonical NTP hydrolase)